MNRLVDSTSSQAASKLLLIYSLSRCIHVSLYLSISMQDLNERSVTTEEAETSTSANSPYNSTTILVKDAQIGTLPHPSDH